MSCRHDVLRGHGASKCLAPSRNHELGSDMRAHLTWIVIDEVPDAVVRDSSQLGPFPKCANRRLLAWREYPAKSQAHNVSELISLRCFELGFHVHGCASTDALVH